MKAFTVIALTVCLVAFGCSPSPQSGAVQRVYSAAPGVMPDVSYVADNGTVGSFEKAREPIAVVAFVAPQGPACCAVDQRLVDLTRRFGALPISVVAVLEPNPNCPQGPGCVPPCNLGHTKMMTLCDVHGQLRSSLGQPQDGAVLLLDSRSRIIGAGTLDDLSGIDRQARDQAYQVEDRSYNQDRIDICIN
jgi:hypothetical protein